MSDKSHTFAFRIRSGQTIDHTVFLELLTLITLKYN